MSAYGGRAVYSQPAYCSKVKRYKAPALAPAFKYRCAGGVKARTLYGELADAWRAGVIADFYYGTRSETDSSLVWLVNGVEWTMTQARGVLEGALLMAGVESIEVGPMWCGYPSLTITYADGSTLVDRYDGCSRVESLNGRPVARETTAVPATRAVCTDRDLFPELSVEAF